MKIFFFFAGIIALLALLGGLLTIVRAKSFLSEDILSTVESPYQSIYVTQQGSIRYLRGGSLNAKTSAMDLEAPHRHVLEYTALMMLGFGYVTEPKEICIIGLGGGTLPKYIRHYYPQIKITNVEFDERMLDMAEKWFDLQPDARMRNVIQDGRNFLRQNRQQYDLIFLDAYHGDYIPFHLLTREFLQLVRQNLSPAGAVIANTWYSQALNERESATYAAVFSRFDSYRARHTTNRIIVAMKNGMPDYKRVRRQLVRIQQKKGFKEIDLPALQQSCYNHNLTWAADSEPLVDDFAPVNFLIGGGKR